MKIKSPAFQHNQPMPAKFTCDGQNINPPLCFSDIPQDAKSLTLIVDDPDAPMGTWVHWTLWNIEPQTKEIPENSVSQEEVEGITSFGKPGYGGPCPPASQRGEPSGTHHYFFKLYALDITLTLNSLADKQTLEKAMEGHIIARTELVGLYRKG